MRRILIVDSDKETRMTIAKQIRMEGYEAVEADNGEAAVSLCRRNVFDLMILEAVIPGVNGLCGFSVLQAVRAFSQMPVLILSTLYSVEKRIYAFELGADDYMAKPFSMKELMLHIGAILKRTPSLDTFQPLALESGGIVVDMTARRVFVDQVPVVMTPKEFDLLSLLVSHPHVAFSRRQLLDLLWGSELPEDTRTLDTHIKQVRRAIAPYGRRIVTLRGIGYRFE